jgi:HSF-type DNA-binding
MNNMIRDNPELHESCNTCSGTKRFPIRLHEMLCDVETKGYRDIVSWLPCGTMFKVIKHKDFAERIMPLYYRHSRYKSFLRQ